MSDATRDDTQLSGNAVLAIARSRRTVAMLSIAGLLGGVSYRLLAPPAYVSQSSFIQQNTGANPALGGLIAQLGVSAPGQNPAAFYTELVQSPELLRGVLTGKGFGRGAVEQNGWKRLVADLGSPRLEDHEVFEKTVTRLRKSLTATTDLRTGIVTLKVSLPTAESARYLNSTLLTLLNTFNYDRRQIRASAERRFLEKRIGEVRADLSSAEDTLRDFLVRNRSTAYDPSLVFSRDRLQRNVTLQTAVLTGLIQANEAAKVDEIRDTPVITVVETPSLPTREDTFGLLADALFGLVFGFAVAIIVITAREVGLAWWRTQPADVRDAWALAIGRSGRASGDRLAAEPNG